MGKSYHIAYCVPNLSGTGGMEKIITAKANYFADELNYRVTLLVSELNNNSIPFYVSPKVTVINLEINQYTSNKIKGVSFINNLKILKQIYTKQIKKIAPDIIIIPERGYEDFFIPHICKDIPKIREYHFSKKASSLLEKELPFVKKLKSRLIKNLYFKQFKKYDAFVVLTEKDKKEWKHIKNIWVIPNYLDPVKIKQTPILNRPKRVISVGSMHNDRKGFTALINFWEQLKKHHQEWTLHIYGDGTFRPKLQKLIEEKNMQTSIFLEGNTNKIERKYQESQLFLFASKGEGLPMVLLEAQQHGLPIVAYNCYCGPSDILTQDNKGGFLVNLNDKNAFINYCDILLDDATLREIKSKEAYINAKRFQGNQIIPLWTNLFDKLIQTSC